MSENQFGNSLVRGLSRFGIPSRLTTPEAAMVDEEKRVTTDAWDRDAKKVELLGKLDEFESKLVRRAGVDAVIKYRRWKAREILYLTDWREVGKSRLTVRPADGITVEEPKTIEPPHRSEVDGRPCRCGLVDEVDAFYRCPYVAKKERLRRMNARDHATVLPVIAAKLKELD